MEDVILIWLLFHSVQVPISLTNLLKKVRKTEIHFIINNFLLVESYILSFFYTPSVNFKKLPFCIILNRFYWHVYIILAIFYLKVELV